MRPAADVYLFDHRKVGSCFKTLYTKEEVIHLWRVIFPPPQHFQTHTDGSRSQSRSGEVTR